MFLCFYFRTLNRLKAFITSWRWAVFVAGNMRDWFAVCSWSIDTWQAMALALLLWAELSGYLAGGKHSEFLQLFSPRKRADLRFLLAGPLLLTQAWSGRVAAHGSEVRGGSSRAAGLGLLKPGLRGALCRRVRHINSLTSPPRIAAAIKFCDGFRYGFCHLHCACALQEHAGRCIIGSTTKLNVTLLSTGGH